MKAKGIILIVIFLAGLIILINTRRNPALHEMKTTVGLEAPDFSFKDASGKNYTLAEMKGQIVFVNFWASWCEPCRLEMPSIQGLYEHFRYEKQFRIITVLYNDDYQTAAGYMKGKNFSFPLFTDTAGNAAKTYGVTGIPESYIIDKKGILRKRIIGPDNWNSPKALAFFSSLLNE